MITTAQRVKEFLHNNPQPRKSVVRFIIVECNKKMSAKDFDKVYANQYRGHYGVNFLKWETLGNITRNKGIYSLSDGFYEKNIGLYSSGTKKRKKASKNDQKTVCTNCKQIERENQDLRYKINDLRRELERVNDQRLTAKVECNRMTDYSIKLERRLEVQKSQKPSSKIEQLLERNNYLLEQIRDNK